MDRIFVFSFNRGPYLDNAIDALTRCCPDLPVTIYDDASDDPETCAVLDKLEAQHTVVRREAASKSRHGSLYDNMQAALDSCGENELAVFLQDDTQVVRPLEAADREWVAQHFARHPDAAFIAPVFLRGSISDKALSEFRFFPEARAYCFHRQTQKCAGMYYSDIAIMHVGRLRAIGWRFAHDELENELAAQARFGRMAYMADPLAMWLPNARAYRNRSKTLAFRLGERLSRSGLYPLRILDEAEVAALRGRDHGSAPPIAEHFLEPVSGELPWPWPFHPLKRWRLLRRLDEIEEALKRLRAWLANRLGRTP